MKKLLTIFLIGLLFVPHLVLGQVNTTEFKRTNYIWYDPSNEKAHTTLWEYDTSSVILHRLNNIWYLKAFDDNGNRILDMDSTDLNLNGYYLEDAQSITDIGSGINESYYLFDEDNDYVLVSDATEIQDIFDNGGGGSALIYPKSDGEADGGLIFYKTKCQVYVTDESNGYVKLEFKHDFDGTNGIWITDNAIIPINKWTYIAWKYDSGDVANNPTVYVNGVEYTVGSGLTESSTPVGTRDSDVGSDIYIGNNHTGGYTFDGMISKVQLFNDTLSATEAKELYSSSVVRYLYQGASQTELITYGDLDDDNGDFEDAGGDGTDIETGTDWVKSSCSAKIDNEAGSGVNSYNGSDFCCKIHTGTDDIPFIKLEGVNIDAIFTVNKKYRISYDYKVENCTDATMRIANVGTATDEEKSLTSTSWVSNSFTFTMDDNTDTRILLYLHKAADPTGDEIVWIDNISIKQIGCVADFSKSKTDGIWYNDSGNENDGTVSGAILGGTRETIKTNLLYLEDSKSAGSETWTNSGTNADTVANTDGDANSLYYFMWTSDPGAPADWWSEAKDDTVIFHTGANVTGTPTYDWIRVEKE